MSQKLVGAYSKKGDVLAEEPNPKSEDAVVVVWGAMGELA